MSTSGLPFDDFRELLANLPGPDEAAVAAVRERDRSLTKPPGALGRLEAIAEWLAAWTGRPPAVNRPLVAVFAGNHGVTRQGVSPFPSEVTAQMVANFAAGGAAINQICIAHDLGLKVFDLALEMPTGDITEEAALDERACAATMAFGMESIAGGTDLLCIGEMGIGNTTIAAAIFHALYGGTAEEWTGPGTGAEGEGLRRKVAAVDKAVALHRPHLGDPLEVLRRLGGREIAAMAGAILAARMQRIPVIIDGLREHRGRRDTACGQRPGARPLPGRPRVGRTRSHPGRGTAGQGPSPVARHAPWRRHRSGPGGRHRQGGGPVPQRHGDLRTGRRQRQGLKRAAVYRQ